MRRSIIIDCDPGVDDCIALMAALGSPKELDIRAICVVAGNVPVETCYRNARGVLALAGREDVPVYAGCERPLSVEPAFADHVHGESGLGGAVLPDSAAPLSGLHAVDYLCETFGNAAPGSITMVITGPMTNLATALARDPKIAAAVDELVIMGGAGTEGGNVTPHAEFNVFADPHAAEIVLNCGRPITLIGLDATLQFRCTANRMQRMLASPHSAVAAASDMIAHVNAVYGEIYGAEGAALHDPCTIGYLLAPELFKVEMVRVSVVCDNAERRGHTAVQAPSSISDGAVIGWVTGLDAQPLFNLLIDRMERL
ncbi:nucleoside hydrolase [Hyphobacterium sp.]|uniref:nucleoside hydrolase n=1 Tax=Hyphobacterium sp. TaxID=2004662 RepID=UPI003BAD694D